VTLHLNTLGDAPSREAWRLALIAYFRDHCAALSEDSQDRLERNPLRILDSKDPRDKPLTAEAPKIDTFLSGEAQDFFGKVCAGLDAAGVAWTRAPALVRGLDYYRHTAFEFVTDRLGAQGTVLGGGRYDGLIETLGGPHTPAVGWAAGIERLAMLLDTKQEDEISVSIAVEDDQLINTGISANTALRHAGLSTEMISSGSPRKRFDKAAKVPARVLVSISMRDGKTVIRTQSAPGTAEFEKVSEILKRFES
jgi:histidyl-tRNA synthetase